MKKSKDYIIFKIRYYADNIGSKKGHLNDTNRKQHRERGQAYNKFFWLMVEKVTGRPFGYWTMEYFLNSRECAIEELFAIHDIYIPNSEEYFYWFIPKDKIDLINWIQSNCNLPFKISKRSPYSSCLNDSKTTWRREEAKQFTDEHLKPKLEKYAKEQKSK